MVTMIIRHGKVGHFKAFGMKDIEEQKVMSTDAIFTMSWYQSEHSGGMELSTLVSGLTQKNT
jgi:hypothetical protein